MNEVLLLGRLTRDIEIKTSGQTTYANFTLAVDDQGNRDNTNFIRCVAFSKTAELLAKYCGKGRQLLVNGSLKVSNHNQKVYYSVITNRITFLHNPNAQNNGTQAPAAAETPAVADEDMPF